MARRAFDVVVAGTALLVASPAPARSRCWPSAWSRAAAPIYRQRRVGKDGRRSTS